MKHYITPAGEVYGFEDYVQTSPHPTIEGGIQFHDINGVPVPGLPHDLVPYEVPAPTLDELKVQAKNRLRAERAPLLAKLDVKFMRNLEEGVDNSAIVAEKKRLRDITKLADPCKTAAELDALKV